MVPDCIYFKNYANLKFLRFPIIYHAVLTILRPLRQDLSGFRERNPARQDEEYGIIECHMMSSCQIVLASSDKISGRQLLLGASYARHDSHGGE